MTNYLKSRMMSIQVTTNYDTNQIELEGIRRRLSAKADKYSCWCILLIDEVRIEAKIIHKGLGKFKIVEDKSEAKYVNKIVDASDVIYCKVKADDMHKYKRQDAKFSD